MNSSTDNRQSSHEPGSNGHSIEVRSRDPANVGGIVESLIDRWETAREDGHELTPEELCIEHPDQLDEVREQIAALKWIPSPHDCEPSGVDDAECGAAPRESFAAAVVLAGRYRLVEPVGEGGFGTVWRGFDTELQRFVAIKIPRGPRARSLANDRFLAEARRLAKLRHPGIVPVFDVGRHAGVVFIVSDLIIGHTLTEELTAGAIPTPRLITVVTQLAAALHAAHSQGFVHRDVKPANILIDENGQAYLTDFGIAVEAEDQLTPSGLSGTLWYMAPEQARGRGEPVDARTDVFALGVVLYELLTGRRPFVADSPAELRQQIMRAQPVSPREVNRQIPPRLAAVCLRALARNPDDRFSSARDMAQAVQTAVRSPLPKRLLPPIVMSTVVVVAVAAFLAVNREAERPDTQSTVPQPTVRTSQPATTSVELERPASQPDDPQTETTPIAITATQVFRGHTGAVSSLALSSDGQRVLSGSWDKTMRLWDTTSGQLIREFRGHSAGIGGVALSTDGRIAATGAGHLYRDATLRLWDVETGDELARFAGHEHNIMAVAWAPNGEFLITGSLDNTIRRWRPDRDAAGDPARDSAAASPAMKLLGTARRPNINNWSGQVWAVAISPDSRQVLAGLRDHTARLIDADSGRQRRALGGHTDQVRSVAFSSDGTRALTASLDGTVRLWNLATGETIREYRPGLGALNTAIFGPEESTILCGGQHDTFVMLDFETGVVRARFTGHTEQIMAFALTPSGDIFSASHDASIRRWHVRRAGGH